MGTNGADTMLGENGPPKKLVGAQHGILRSISKAVIFCT